MTDKPDDTGIENRVEDRVEEVRRYCRKVGRAPSTVSTAALNNSKGMERLLRRLARVKDDLKRYEEYMSKNPPS